MKNCFEPYEELLWQLYRLASEYKGYSFENYFTLEHILENEGHFATVIAIITTITKLTD